MIYLKILLIAIGVTFSQTNCGRYSKEYIPKDLTDAVNYLDCTWSEKDKEEFKSKNENDAISELHMGTGMGIRNGWELWKGKNSICRYFKSKGISHPDDISSIVLTSFHRHLNHKPIDLNGQIKSYKQYWQQAREKYGREDKILKGTKKQEFDSYQKGDTVKIAFKLYTNQKYPQVYSIQGHPDLKEEPNCFVTGIVRGKHIRNGTDYTLKIQPIDICGYQKIYWSGIHEKYGDFKVGEVYNFFSLTQFKISRK